MATSNPGAPKIISVIIKLFAAIPLLLGLGLLAGAGFTGSRQYTILKKWPTVDAEVTRSELTHRLATFGKDKRPRTVYQAQMEFRYAVGGKQYTAPAGSTYSTTDYAEMKLKVDTYTPGTHHPIRYNPANPNDIRFDAGYTFDFFLNAAGLRGDKPGVRCDRRRAVLCGIGDRKGEGSLSFLRPTVQADRTELPQLWCGPFAKGRRAVVHRPIQRFTMHVGWRIHRSQCMRHL